MNDFEKEVREKKSIASGARHRVNGSKSKRCTLPSDYLTPAQRKKLNGEVYTVNLNKPITWGELKALQPSMAKEYVEHLHRTHRATATGAAKMLGTSKENYRKFCGSIGADVHTRRGRTSEKDEKTWADFIAQRIPHPAEEENVPDQLPETVKPAPAQPMKPESMWITLTGDLEQLAAYIKLLPMDGRLRMTVTLEQIKEETP